MEQTILGLNLWAWLGFLFLILAGICSAKAAKVSTKQTVKKEVAIGVDRTLEGTQGQIDYATRKMTHPVQNLYDFAVKEHKVKSDEFLDKIRMSKNILKMIEDKRNQNDNVEVKKITIEQLTRTSREISKEMSVLSNQYQHSLSSLEILIEDLDDGEIRHLFNRYKNLVNAVFPFREEFKELSTDVCKQLINNAKTGYAELIDKISQKKREILAE